MATPTQAQGGFEFVKSPPDRVLCLICMYPNRDPYITSCCGHTFCKSCVDILKEAKFVSCPACRMKEPEFKTVPNKALDREIRALHIYCTNKERGCKWQGEINNIKNHVGNSDGCQFEEVKCSNECGKMIQRQYLTSHVETECPRRKVDQFYHHDSQAERLNQNVIKWMLEARAKGDAIKVRYGKVLFSGSCATGKTSFFRLLMKKKFKDQYMSTGLADAHRVIFATKVYIQPSTSDEDVEFEVLDFNSEISQLRSHVRTKVPNTTHVSTLQKTESMTEIETDIAANLETDQIPEETIWDILTFMDTGGQPEYISMLPAVNNSVMMTFVVHKMEGGVANLDSPVTVVHSCEHCFKPYSLGYSNLDLINTLISFTNNIFLHKKPFLDEVCYKKGNSVSYLSFVGTYLDKVSENDISEIDKVLARTVADSELKNVWAKLNPKFDYLIPVDNTTAGQTDEDKCASKIRKKIHHLLQEQDIYEVPYIWLLLELEIRKVCKDRGCSFITYTEVLELCKEKKLINNNEDFIRNGLKFHHLFGVLLYFDEVEGMQNLIITDHEWLFNKLTDIVLHSYYSLTSKDFYDFEHRGIFNKTLLDKMDLATEFKMSGIDIKAFDVKLFFLNLLQHLKIIAPIENSTKYFMPCLLQNCNFAEGQQEILQNYGTNCVVTDDNCSLPIEPLLIQFKLRSSSDQVGSFPRGVFCCLVVQILQDHQNWRLQWSPNTKKLFSNLVTFFLEDRNCGHYITLIDRLFFLEVQVTHDCKIVYGSTIHHHIFCIVRDALHKVGKSLNLREFMLSYGFLCHECKKPEVHVAKLTLNETYLFCYCDQPTKVTLSHKIWFSDFSAITDDVGSAGFIRSLETAYTREATELVRGAVVVSQIQDKKVIPTMKDLNRYITKRYANDWKDIGLELELELDILKIISKDNQHDCVACFQSTLDRWLKSTPNATWHALEVAITNVRRAHLCLEPVSDVYSYT